MAYEQVVQLKGDSQKYRLSPLIKKYTLRDLGFNESKSGKFQLERPLDPSMNFNQGFKFKMIVAPDLKTFKMATTTANGMREVNIFTSNGSATHVEQLNYILDELLKRQVIEKC